MNKREIEKKLSEIVKSVLDGRDVEEIVRCKDCIFSDGLSRFTDCKSVQKSNVCVWHGRFTKDDHFCSDGKRK